MDIAPGLEQQIMLAILKQHPDAYGVSIKSELKELNPSLGAIYAAVERLEARGLISARQGSVENKRGGRAKLLLTVTAKGVYALRASLAPLDRLRGPLDLLPEGGLA